MGHTYLQWLPLKPLTRSWIMLVPNLCDFLMHFSFVRYVVDAMKAWNEAHATFTQTPRTSKYEAFFFLKKLFLLRILKSQGANGVPCSISYKWGLFNKHSKKKKKWRRRRKKNKCGTHCQVILIPEHEGYMQNWLDPCFPQTVGWKIHKKSFIFCGAIFEDMKQYPWLNMIGKFWHKFNFDTSLKNLLSLSIH